MDGSIAPAGFPCPPIGHNHVFLGAGHEQSERRTWWVIALCGAMMVLEIVGGLAFGSIALVADGLHMSTHAGALLLAALAYTCARKYAHDGRFTFGTGKLGDLAGFTSAIVLAMIALLIGYEAVTRLFAPVPIHFAEAIPIAALGLAVNVASVWLLNGGGHHHHGHGHGHDDDHAGDHTAHDEEHRITTPEGVLTLSVFEDGVPPVFRLRPQLGQLVTAGVTVETVRPDGTHQLYSMQDRGGWLESFEAIPEPHQFTAHVQVGSGEYQVSFEEHDHGHDGHGAAHRDNNMRAAVIHVVADAAVSVLVIVGLLLARAFGWLWMDPLAGIIGACVIASWSYGLARDTGAILLDMVPDQRVAGGVRQVVEAEGDRLADLHLWRLGPGHLGAIVSVATRTATRGPEHYHRLLARFSTLSHVTVEVRHAD
ncbi:CDF family Co(II)/Ni(II) efflux transporter DmeF [Lichenicoccus roseus]|uniref:CDF family Co(II)/Ni(II) efflux transporter DmeF n=1 Tax=Lichenicoccus roseus TaxID=2683649 RepID=A0A5R9J683_9PROT|nr:CDF family Co(II)/Ni(II) efflux transporter DmeF [Lichenicoccus roseus]TLU71121.1 CDF family Co(II)/Ni(II) efflux transporter DmeF [Lichenicoccus roseus]